VEYSTISVAQQEGLLTVTLKRPESKNRLNARMVRELTDVTQTVRDDQSIVVVVLRGNGVFCAGVDAEVSEGDGLASIAGVTKALASLDRVLVAAIDGECLSAGLELALACDVRLATPRATFGFPEVSRGTIPAGGGTQRLPRIVGRAAAIELLLLAEPISADEAFRIGLVNRVVDDLDSAVQELATMLLSRGPLGLRYAKEAIAKGLDMTLEQGLRLEGDLNFLLQTTADRAEGVRAFLEKRLPDFHGH
jgi:enoyl-CoA hydratase